MNPPEVNPILLGALERWLAHHVGGRLNIVAHEPPGHAIEAVAKSDSLITIVNGARAQSMPVPGITYRAMSPSPLADFGIAHQRNDPSRIVANLLDIADELARAQPRDTAREGELLLSGLS
jgi:hypothetical protein